MPDEIHQRPSSPAMSLPPRQAYLRPQYVDQFRCIGSACEDTCCMGWSVPIDQATYEKYTAIEALKPHLGTTIVLNPEGAKSFDYARINTTNTSACFFLDEEHLCGIQKRFGPSFLSSTCATYPRAVANISGEEERALNLSCPEAARLTLFHDNLLGSSEVVPQTMGAERYADFVHDFQRLQQAAPIPGDELPYDPLLATREFALLLLADRCYPLWQRLLLLGTVTRQLQALSQGRPEAAFAVENPVIVAKLLADSATMISQDQLRAAMDAVQLQPAEQLPLILKLLRLRVSQLAISPRFLECLQEFEAGLGTATVTNDEQLLTNFTHAYRSYLRPLLERHPHLLENYLTNYVFRTNYPFGRPADQPPSENAADASTQHMRLCAQFGILQTMLIGMAAHDREAFDEARVVKLVQSLAKAFEHSISSLREMSTFIAQRNLNNLRGIALLVKPND